MRNNRETTRMKWRELHLEFSKGTQKAREFCAERGINYYTFMGWRGVFGKQKKQGTERGLFRELPPVWTPESLATYGVRLRSGRTLELTGGFVESEVRKLIEVLESC